MASLTLSSQPGFTDLAASLFDAGNTVSDTTAKALNDAARFAAVRNEQFWGFYRNGETVGLPTSPADGYTYARNELLYSWSFYWTGSAVAALLGTHSTPTRGATTGGGTLLQAGAFVDPATGAVSTNVSYFKTAQVDTNDGILVVVTHAQRNR